MMKTRLTSIFFLIIVTQLCSQETVFIEPFVSFTFDTTIIQKDEVFSNSIYGTEEHSFKLKSQEQYFNLTISAQKLTSIPSAEEIDAYLNSQIEGKKTQDDPETKLIYAEIFEINNFFGVATIIQVENEKVLMFDLQKLEDNRLTTVIQMTRTDKNSLESNSVEFNYINEATSNIKTYDSKTIDQLENEIIELYQIEVEALPLRNLYYYSIEEDGEMIQYQTYERDSVPFEVGPDPFHHSFRGQLVLTPELQHAPKEIRIKNTGSEQVFEIKANAELIFTSTDKKKGEINKNGKLIVTSNIGKEIEIPFRFSYKNE